LPNPQLKQFPLRHKFGYNFTLQEFESTHNHTATILPLIVADQGRDDLVAEVVQVHPANDTFEGVVNTPACHMNARINNLKISEYVSIPKDIDEPDNIYYKAIMSLGLGDSDVVAADGTTILSKLALTKGADNIMPTYVAASDLEHSSLVHADIDTLDTSQLLEGVALLPSALRQHLVHELGPKMSAIVQGPYINRVHKDFPYFREAWYKVPPRVKRMNAFSGCFLYVGLNESIVDGLVNTAADKLSPHFDDRLTIEEESLDFHYLIEYNEWHDAFDQSP